MHFYSMQILLPIHGEHVRIQTNIGQQYKKSESYIQCDRRNSTNVSQW